ncbi:hypothetical protein CLIB1423_06S03268 [[Candida] railenensis]|uniref:Uncharacterized protein n=1 Tax=[Candida] railenensis TaxID=45579 RepID=A0A9P0VYA1_9ASCO|nr:hypothetical protein CLIB1423_06S03268 [[Candida] railenensis]
MSNKYTPLDSAEDSSSIPETVPPSYELDEIIPGASNGNNHVYCPPQPLQVEVHTDDNVLFKSLKLKLNYYPNRGVDGIHQIIRTKLNSMGIDLGDEVYSIGELENSRFRLILIDEDAVGDEIHYFKEGKESAIAKSISSADFWGVIFMLSCIIIIFILFFFIIRYLATR